MNANDNHLPSQRWSFLSRTRPSQWAYHHLFYRSMLVSKLAHQASIILRLRCGLDVWVMKLCPMALLNDIHFNRLTFHWECWWDPLGCVGYQQLEDPNHGIVNAYVLDDCWRFCRFHDTWSIHIHSMSNHFEMHVASNQSLRSLGRSSFGHPRRGGHPFSMRRLCEIQATLLSQLFVGFFGPFRHIWNNMIYIFGIFWSYSSDVKWRHPKE